MKTPVVVAPSAVQFVVGAAVVAQQVPRAVSVSPPLEVTLAPSVAPVEVIEVAVGEVRVGAVAEVVKLPSDEYEVPTLLVA